MLQAGLAEGAELTWGLYRKRCEKGPVASWLRQIIVNVIIFRPFRFYVTVFIHKFVDIL